MLYLECDGHYMSASTCQKSLTVHVQWGHFMVCNLYFSGSDLEILAAYIQN